VIESTFVMIKPDGVRRKLIGEVIKRFEQKGLDIERMKMVKLTKKEAEKLYEVHRGKDFFEKLINYTISGPVVLMKMSGENAVLNCRIVVGETYPEKRHAGSIRGDFSLYLTENVVHASSSKEDAERELNLFF
jgi:nucleoside-diphosphate kinase